MPSSWLGVPRRPPDNERREGRRRARGARRRRPSWRSCSATSRSWSSCRATRWPPRTLPRSSCWRCGVRVSVRALSPTSMRASASRLHRARRLPALFRGTRWARGPAALQAARCQRRCACKSSPRPCASSQKASGRRCHKAFELVLTCRDRRWRARRRGARSWSCRPRRRARSGACWRPRWRSCSSVARPARPMWPPRSATSRTSATRHARPSWLPPGFDRGLIGGGRRNAAGRGLHPRVAVGRREGDGGWRRRAWRAPSGAGPPASMTERMQGRRSPLAGRASAGDRQARAARPPAARARLAGVRVGAVRTSGRRTGEGHDAVSRAAQLKAEDEGAAAELKRLLRSTASIYRTLLSHAEAAHVEVPPAPRPGPKPSTAASERPPCSLLHCLCLACMCLGRAHSQAGPALARRAEAWYSNAPAVVDISWPSRPLLDRSSTREKSEERAVTRHKVAGG